MNYLFAAINYVDDENDDYNIIYVVSEDYWKANKKLDTTINNNLHELMHSNGFTAFDNSHWEPSGLWGLEELNKALTEMGLTKSDEVEAYAKDDVQKYGAENI